MTRLLTCVLLLFSVVLGVGAGCSGARSPYPIVHVSFETSAGRTPDFTMEVVANDADRAKGLMFRKSMPELHGMFFVFRDDGVKSFWMKNTLLSLDMVFVDGDLRVVGILTDVPPLNEEQRTVGKPSRYVLEFNAGTMKKYGVAVNDKLRIDGVLPPAS